MGNPLGETGSEGVGSGQEPQGAPGTGHPAWNEYLADIPQEFHDKVTPAFQKWDSEVQKKIQSVHSEYEPYKPFKESNIPPERLDYSLQVANAIETDPELVYKALVEHYGPFGEEKPKGNEQGQNGEEIDPYDERFAELERQNKLMAQALLTREEAAKHAEEDAALDEEMQQVYGKYGKLDETTEKMILGFYASGAVGTAEEAADAYFANLERASKARAPRPLIAGPGGGAPHTGIDPKKLDDKGTKNLVVDMLKAAAEQRE